jgi:hypothetical protein
MKDCIDRGRFRANGAINPEKGSDRYNAKLTEEDAAYIKSSSEKGIDLADRFGVTPGIISEIRSGKRWKHA